MAKSKGSNNNSNKTKSHSNKVTSIGRGKFSRLNKKKKNNTKKAYRGQGK